MSDRVQVSIGEANNILKYGDSYSRMLMLLEMSPLGKSEFRLSYPDWYRTLGQWWSVCDNIGQYRKALKLAMYLGSTPTPIPEMMNEEEQAALAALPERITVYRGCGAENMLGASWSLERDVAAGFPYLNRYKVREPVLVTATVRRDRICALKLNRNEHEIITFNARRLGVESLTEAIAA